MNYNIISYYKLILFFFTFTIFANTNFKDFSNQNQKATLLYFVKSGNKDKIFKNKKVSKLLNDKFMTVKVTDRSDLINRYLLTYHITDEDTIVLIDKNGEMVSRANNFSEFTLENILLHYLNNPQINKNMKEKKQKIFAHSYFRINSRIFSNRTRELERLLKKDKKIKLPLLNITFSILDSKNNYSLKLWAKNHIDILLKSKIFNNNHIFKKAIRSWDNPVKNSLLIDNINLLKSLLILEKSDNKYKETSKKVLNFLKNEFKIKNLLKREKLELLSLFNRIYLDGLYKDATIKLIDQLKNSPLLSDQISVLRGYISLNSDNKDIEKQIDYIHEHFYLTDQAVFQDSEIGKEPFNYRYISDEENIELSTLFIKLYNKHKNDKYLIYAENILSFVNSIPIDKLIKTKYIYTASFLSENNDGFNFYTYQ